jgi:hypothetical protein
MILAELPRESRFSAVLLSFATIWNRTSKNATMVDCRVLMVIFNVLN